jgi:ABC-type transport system substrate-binding protein
MTLRRMVACVAVLGCVLALAGSAVAAGEEIVVQTHALNPATPLNWIDHSVATGNDAQLVLYPTCLKLVNFDEDSDAPVPEAAAAMPVVSGGGTTYTFTIASGHAFSNGESVTAASFERAIQRARTLSAAGATFMSDVTSVSAAGDTLTITLAAPAGDFLSRLALNLYCATPSDAPAAASSTPLAAAGPYYIQSASPAEIVLVRNPNYGGTRTQNLGTIRWRPLGAAGGADYIVDPIASFATPAGMDEIVSPTTGIEMLFLNTTRPTFSSETMRRAVAYAVNRTAVSATYSPALQPTDTFLSPLVSGAVDHDVYPLDGSGAATAVGLLGGATPSISLCYPANRGPAAALLQSQLQAVGFAVGLEPYGSEFFTVVVPDSARCDMRLFTVFPSYPDPAAVLPFFFDGDPNGALNRSFFDDPGFNARFDAASATTNEAARLAEYADLDFDLAFAAPNVAVGFRSRRDILAPRIGCTALSRARFGGYALNRLCVELSDTAAPGGTVSTGGDATPAAPLQTSVTVPDGGEVTITQGISDANVVPAFGLLEQQLDISVDPDGTVEEPLVLTFEIDAQTLAAAGLTVGQVVVLRNGEAVADPCEHATRADPDPCVASRSLDGEGDGVIVVRTSQASTWNFAGGRATGPFQPVDALPTVNTVKAGRAVPFRFSLGGSFGLDVLASGYPKSEGGPCSSGPTDLVETTSNGAGLTYDASTQTYTYHWKTASSWKGQCRTLTVRLRDGQELRADFRFT